MIENLDDVLAYTNVYHKGKLLKDFVGNKEYIKNIESLTDKNADVFVGYIPAGYAHRPDLISELFYSSPKYWWLVLLYNNISDPFEGLNVNDKILLPKL